MTYTLFSFTSCVATYVAVRATVKYLSPCISLSFYVRFMAHTLPLFHTLCSNICCREGNTAHGKGVYFRPQDIFPSGLGKYRGE